MTARTGAEYLAGLRDDRTVWLGHERVDVATHPAFAGSLSGMAGYFDWQHAHADECLVEDPETGKPMSASLIVPKTADDIRRRHRAFESFARYSCGMLGRTPDYVNVTLAGFVAQSNVLTAKGDATYAERMRRFHREVVEKDLSLTHTIIHPVVDKSLPDLEGVNGKLALRVVRRTKDSIVVRGAKILATLGPFADELFVYPGQPQPPGADTSTFLSFSIPMASKGLITLCRDHYGVPASVGDRPFSARFDEQDAFMIFDDVEIPNERVFIDGDPDVYNGLMRHGWAANIMQQTCIRAAVKLEFAYELAARMAQATNSDKRPDTAAMLGELWDYACLTRSAVKAAEMDARDWGNGAFFPDDRPLRAVRSMMPGWMVRANDIIKTVGSHNLLATPSLDAIANPAIGPLIEEFMPGANGMSARERAKLFRTAWDFAGSALGGRVELYERFYLASAPRNMALDHMLAQAERPWTQLPETLAAAGVA
ncbi:MAG TPA: 4-hydroxyphenylacetate 3-hydroxylase N-terminal domain-containing protein [Caulobacteraceae bacterium]|nr:4-hydroxyphenylacetate 3-hydroxylase N-terminal domain-containing protein [Caulobacteraceae bacterium]